jgi:proline dehydrogenase
MDGESMLRAGLIGLSKAGWAREAITRWGVARRTARRFVAGETPEEAIQAVRELNKRGMLATLDQLGENTVTAEDARTAAEEIEGMLERIQRTGVRSNVSIKLSQIGLLVDAELCRENLLRVLTQARACRNFVRIDMEDSTLTERTIALFREARAAGFENVGIVLQAYLLRSETDARGILEIDGRVRLCKGAYNEPASVAFPVKADVDANYDCLAELLLDHVRGGVDALREDERSAGRIPPIAAIATHDPQRIAHAREYAERIGLAQGAFEFQMLYGIRRDLQESLTAQGYALRVYVPYGSHWYPYLMRRMAERPANLWFIGSNLFRR